MFFSWGDSGRSRPWSPPDFFFFSCVGDFWVWRGFRRFLILGGGAGLSLRHQFLLRLLGEEFDFLLEERECPKSNLRTGGAHSSTEACGTWHLEQVGGRLGQSYITCDLKRHPMQDTIPCFSQSLRVSQVRQFSSGVLLFSSFHFGHWGVR